MKTLAEKVWSKVLTADPSSCWLWTGATGRHGHGHLQVGGRGSKFTAAHRAAYELTYGPVPETAEVCHSCDNRRCCNPSHLWVGTHKENMQDMSRKQRSPRQKLTADQVIAMRAAFEAGPVTFTELGRLFGVSRVQARNIVTHRQRVA